MNKNDEAPETHDITAQIPKFNEEVKEKSR